MPYSRPNSRYRRSLLNRRLLCGLALIAGSTLGGAQEPQGDIGPNPPPLDTGLVDAPQAQGLETDAPDPTTQDPEVFADGGDALEFVARLEAQILLTELVDQARYEEAVPIAERMVELTEEESGVSIELGVALSNLAILQRSLELYEPSELNFVRAVDVIREADGTYSEAVISPLVGLGMNYQARGDYFEAETTYEEARTVSRRVHGLLNEQQIDILDHLASTMLDMQRYAEADELQLTSLHLMERIHGRDTPGVLPAIYKYARWLRSGYRFQEERGQYVRAMDIIRNYEGDTSQSMVRPLRETGISYRTQKLPEGRGVSALRRALEIAEDQPTLDSRLIAETLVDIGDWNIAFSKVGATGEEYRRAWQLLGELADGDALREEWFNDPVYVLRENPSSRGIGSPNDPGALPGHVLVTFDVTEFGKTTNVTVVESVPPGLKDDSTARAIARSRFRPRMVDGELVRAQGLARNFTFHYLPEE